MPQDNKALEQEFVERVLNGGDIEATGRYFHDNVVEEVPLPGQGPGLEGLKWILRHLRTAFPDLHWNNEEQIAEANKVVSRFTWTGTHRGEFLGVPATGRKVSVWGVVINHVDGQKIKSTRIIMDSLGLMQQLGVIPGPPPA